MKHKNPLHIDDLKAHATRIGIPTETFRARIYAHGLEAALQMPKRTLSQAARIGKRASPWGNGAFVLPNSRFGS